MNPDSLATMLRLKSDYFRIEIREGWLPGVFAIQLKSDYFRIEIRYRPIWKWGVKWLKSDYFRIEIEDWTLNNSSFVHAKIRLF